MSTAVLRALPARYLGTPSRVVLRNEGGVAWGVFLELDSDSFLREVLLQRRRRRVLGDEAVAVALWHAVHAAVGLDAGHVAARGRNEYENELCRCAE